MVVGALLTAALTACGAPMRASAPVNETSPLEAAQPVPTDPRIGAVFLAGEPLHTCTAAVLDSAGGDLVLTAAHCLADGVDTEFVAGFSDDDSALRVWHVDAVYLDPRWVADQDPRADFAIARVSGDDDGASPEALAGGGLTLGRAPASGTAVTVTGYGMGVGGGPIGCHATTEIAAGGFPAVACAGLVAGLSGAPWVTGSSVTGVVGGLDGGGCDEDLSYSPPFDGRIGRLLARAEAGGADDAAPVDFDDGC